MTLALLAFAQQNFDDVQIETIQVRDNIYMLIGGGGNIGLVVGDDGSFIIDDQFAPLTEKFMVAIAAITDKLAQLMLKLAELSKEDEPPQMSIQLGMNNV